MKNKLDIEELKEYVDRIEEYVANIKHLIEKADEGYGKAIPSLPLGIEVELTTATNALGLVGERAKITESFGGHLYRLILTSGKHSGCITMRNINEFKLA